MSKLFTENPPKIYLKHSRGNGWRGLCRNVASTLIEEADAFGLHSRPLRHLKTAVRELHSSLVKAENDIHEWFPDGFHVTDDN